MTTLKILVTNERSSGGGAARASYEITKAVNGCGADAKMFVRRRGEKDDFIISLEDFEPRNIFHKIIDFVAKKIKNKIQHARWRPYKHTKDGSYKSDLRGTRIFGALEKIDYDVLHLHWINNRFIKIEDLPAGKPIVWTLHDSWPFCGVCHYFFDCTKYQDRCGACPELGSTRQDDLSARCLKRKAEIYSKLDLHIVAPSRWLADCARKSSLFGGLDVSVIPNCIDTELFKPLQATPDSMEAVGKKLEKRFGKPFVLYGAVNAATDKRKGFPNLLSALELLVARGRTDLRLLVFGASEGDLPICEGIETTYLGYISDSRKMAELYSFADVMVVPSLTENLSCVIMESLACGTPVTAFDIGGNGDMIDHKLNGYLAPEGDDAALADGIEWCLANNSDRTLSRNARDKVMRCYTPEVVGRQYVELYERAKLAHT